MFRPNRAKQYNNKHPDIIQMHCQLCYVCICIRFGAGYIIQKPSPLRSHALSLRGCITVIEAFVEVKYIEA